MPPKDRSELIDGAWQRRRQEDGVVGWASPRDYAEHIESLEKALTNHGPATGRALEIGCGAGNISLWLAERGYRVTGVDFSPTALEWAQELCGERVELLHSDVTTLSELADGSFDLVIDGHCLHWIIGDDRARVLASVNRVLEPNGFFHVHTMCGDHLPPDVGHFDSETRCVIKNGVSTAYIGRAEDLVAEIGNSFDVLHWEVEPHRREDDSDTLSLSARKV